MAEAAPRKRRRPAKACEQCRQRKVRCDLNVPCGPCARAKSPLDCVYRDGPFGPDGTVHHFPSDNPLPVQAQAPAAQPRPRGIGGSMLTPTSPTDVSTANNPDLQQAIRDIHTHLGLLEKRLSESKTDEVSVQRPGLERELRALTARVETLEGQLPTGSKTVNDASAPGQDRALMPALTPQLRSSTAKVKLMGPTHWCNKMQQISAIRLMAKNDPERCPNEVTTRTTVKECKEMRRSIKLQHAVRLNEPLPDLRSTIPSKQECEELVHCYLRTFESIYRVIHIPSFWMDYEEFWRESKATSSPFLVKLVLILAIGTVFRTGEVTPISDEYYLLVQKWTYAAQWWLAGPSEKSTHNLDGLQVMCLLFISRKACGMGPSPWLSAGSLMRAAVGMGLHRNPTAFPCLPTLQAEMRLRLWATVVELALQESMDLSIPILLPTNFDASAPSNLDDKDLGTDTSSESTSDLSDRLTDVSVQVLLHRSVRLRVQVLEVIHDCQGQSYKEALELGSKLRAVCRKVAALVRSAKSGGRSSSSLALTDFHAGFLDIQLHRYILALYTPFMIQAIKDPQYYYARKACLESAAAIASYADALQLPSEIPGDLPRLFVSGKGSFKGPLSLDLISVLGVEIVTQLEEEYPPCLPGLERDPLDRLAQANRDSLIQKLEHILHQLFHIMSKGIPSMKRYGLLGAVLGQIRAMKGGHDIKRAVYDAVKQSFKDCQAVLQSSGTQATGPTEGLVSGTPGQGFDFCDPILSDINMGLEDPLFDLDFQWLFSPGFDGNAISLFA
ncbi:hypothetical protein BJX76DRAFT_357588 [Aspergillus varians]